MHNDHDNWSIPIERGSKGCERLGDMHDRQIRDMLLALSVDCRWGGIDFE